MSDLVWVFLLVCCWKRSLYLRAALRSINIDSAALQTVCFRHDRRREINRAVTCVTLPHILEPIWFPQACKHQQIIWMPLYCIQDLSYWSQLLFNVWELCSVWKEESNNGIEPATLWSKPWPLGVLLEKEEPSGGKINPTNNHCGHLLNGRHLSFCEFLSRKWHLQPPDSAAATHSF